MRSLNLCWHGLVRPSRTYAPTPNTKGSLGNPKIVDTGRKHPCNALVGPCLLELGLEWGDLVVDVSVTFFAVFYDF